MTAITAWHGTTQVHHTEIVPVQLMDQTWNLHGIPPLTTCHQHSVVQNKQILFIMIENLVMERKYQRSNNKECKNYSFVIG